ncbi:GGDEF domain-containing protein [Modestobacter caceresii]|uniref:GGDEF domain-containing protein n=1 Tax=Modestobacter caceresii TaxID=1522368 RepID=UPI00068DA289|nr:GGDEF domain-containing protein [Modestobacter caceresii]
MTRHPFTSAAGRPDHDDSRQGGRSVAERAIGQIRLIAVALLLVGGAGHRPAAGGPLGRDLAFPLAGGAAAILLLVALLTARAATAAAGRRSKLALAGTVADAVVVLGVVGLAGLPPQSFALVLLMLPFLEAALWFGLTGLAGLWTASSVLLGALVMTLPGQVPDEAFGVLVIAMPTLLLATIPVAMLAEHLVAQVGRLAEARTAADDRARLLGDLSAITADIFPLDGDAVLVQLVTGAQRLGAIGATVIDPGAGRHAQPLLAAAGDAQSVPSVAGDGPGGGTPATATTPDAEDRSAVLTRQLTVPGGTPYTFTAVVVGSAEEVTRRLDALDLLVAQARVALANAMLVQQLEQLKQTFEEQATRDQLTGLLNRRGLVLRAEQLPGRLGVLFCDLDGFKGVNDTLGHAAGDELLEQVARRLEGGLRSGSVLGRMGGDEFVVVVPGASDEDLAGLGRRIEADLDRPFLLEAGMARIGVSIGVAHADDGERDLDALLGCADQLMYEVKRSKKAGGSAQGELAGAPA